MNRLAADVERLFADLAGSRWALVGGWAGIVLRRSNQRGQSPEIYGKRLIYDGLKKGWLR